MTEMKIKTMKISTQIEWIKEAFCGSVCYSFTALLMIRKVVVVALEVVDAFTF